MGDWNGKCDECGRFMRHAPGATWADQYDFVAMCCDYTRYRCIDCTKKLGPVHSNARPASGDMSPYEGEFRT
jgi:hypothetical protein